MFTLNVWTQKKILFKSKMLANIHTNTLLQLSKYYLISEKCRNVTHTERKIEREKKKEFYMY